MNNHIKVPSSCAVYRNFDELYDERVTMSFNRFTGKPLARAVTIGLTFIITRPPGIQLLAHFAIHSCLKEISLYIKNQSKKSCR